MRDLIHSELIDDDEYRAAFSDLTVIPGALCSSINHTCPSCGKPSKDGQICDDCWDGDVDDADAYDADYERNDAARRYYNGEP